MIVNTSAACNKCENHSIYSESFRAHQLYHSYLPPSLESSEARYGRCSFVYQSAIFRLLGEWLIIINTLSMRNFPHFATCALKEGSLRKSRSFLIQACVNIDSFRTTGCDRSIFVCCSKWQTKDQPVVTVEDLDEAGGVGVEGAEGVVGGVVEASLKIRRLVVSNCVL